MTPEASSYLDVFVQWRHVGGRRERVEDPVLTFNPRARQVGHVDVLVIEDDGVALL